MMQKEFKVVVTDTSCFIILEKIDAIHLSNQLFAEFVTTPEIVEEYSKPLPNWVIIKSVENIALQKEFNNYIDPGEASAIALASEIKSDYIILDDLEARRFAEKLGLNVKGSVGVLLYAKQSGAITLIRPYLEKIQASNFRVSQRIIDNILKEAGEN